ncbi:hypothetical protein PIROE2DRAFT_16815 [Piromyces sp. E2]|nr:hypothetical protein PIROE2DRAFT_16815 [Piromyces sp. E2]|eukprot:OUM58020.1 hypothetical protein PIROE2DRAFT_16815 [Piromyces sp. E2]
MVLFGGSIIAGGDVLAKAIKDQVAKTYIIVGGAGHTTETLRQKVHKEYPEIKTAGLSEAEIFQQYIKINYNCEANYLETESTNCGNNITYLLDLIKAKNITCHSIILCQDATMQNRMEAKLRKDMSHALTIINYASYAAVVEYTNENLHFSTSIHGMWDMERYVNLLMGEIPRLSDNEHGYGPKGKNFIDHVDIPEKVIQAFELLKQVYGNEIREANPLYASK